MTTPADHAPAWPPHDMDAWVPHRGAMSLLSSVERCDELSVVARVRVPAQGVFATPFGVPAWVGIEYMAQAVAAWSGARNREGGGSPRIGYLLGSRRYEAHVPVFPVGAELRVFGQCELMGDNGLGMFDCRIEHDGRVLASGRLSVFEPPANPGKGSPQSAPGERGS
jgi:predicted hotdog family 3-hydroxylacyl-ACP dehydratase